MSAGQMTLPVLAGFTLLALVWWVTTYNRLVQLKHEVSRALANIDVLLRQRHDELPKLIETCRQYRQFEQDTLQKVIDARSRVQQASANSNVGALGAAESDLRGSVGRVFAIAEAYPELKANTQFVALQTRITALESGIADRREVYNDAANVQNIRLEQFPDSWVASFGDFRPAALLHFTAAETADVNVKALFA